MKKTSKLFAARGPLLNPVLANGWASIPTADIDADIAAPPHGGVKASSTTSATFSDCENVTGPGVLEFVAFQARTAGNSVEVEIILDGESKLLTTMAAPSSKSRVLVPVGIVNDLPYWNGSAMAYAAQLALGPGIAFEQSCQIRHRRTAGSAAQTTLTKVRRSET